MGSGPVTYGTRKEASAYLASVEMDVRGGRWQDTRRRIPTMDEYMPRFQASRMGRGGGAIRATTRALSEDQYAKYVRDQLGYLTLDHIDEPTVRRWYYALPDRPAQRRQLYSLVNAIMNAAIRDHLIEVNPCRIRGASQIVKTSRPYFTYGQVERVFTELPSDLRVLAQVAFNAHLRVGEALALRWIDVDVESGRINVHQTVSEVRNEQIVTGTKTADGRTVTMGSTGREALADYARSKGWGPVNDNGPTPDSRIFVRSDGSALRYYHVEGAWKRARQRAGVPELNLHDLRHVSLTMLAETGATLKSLMARAGHTTYRAALIYQNRATTQDADDAAALDRLMDQRRAS